MKNETKAFIWKVLFIVVFLWGAIMLYIWSAGKVRADDDPPKTSISICGGGLPSLSLRDAAQDGCKSYDITATDPEHPDYLEFDQTAFRHIYYVSGDPACVGTGSYPLKGKFDSGRDITTDPAESPQKAYVAWGFAVYGITGKSCSEAGVSMCQGGFCR